MGQKPLAARKYCTDWGKGAPTAPRKAAESRVSELCKERNVDPRRDEAAAVGVAAGAAATPPRNELWPSLRACRGRRTGQELKGAPIVTVLFLY